MHRGYVRFWRKSLDSGMIQNHKLWVFWTWCLLKATHKPQKQMVGMQMVELEPGQFIFGRKAASKELKISEQTIRTCINRLKTLENLTIKATNKFSIITIVNWDSYQQEISQPNQPNNPQVTSNQPAANHKQTHKNIRSIIKLPKGNSSPEPVKPDSGDVLPPKCPHKKIQELYNQKLGNILPYCKVTNNSVDKNLRTRWRECAERQSLEWWGQYFDEISKSDFLMGRSESSFQASFEWIVRPTNMTKILNGNYANRGAGGGRQEKLSDYMRRTGQ